MELNEPQDLLSLSSGDTVSKRNLFDLIQYSKVEGSDQWSGAEWAIGNTPQQGINWIGNLPHVEAVIIKTRQGSYTDDGWADEQRRSYQYSFKARKGAISFAEKANQVLVQQPENQLRFYCLQKTETNGTLKGALQSPKFRSGSLYYAGVQRRRQRRLPCHQMEKLFMREGGVTSRTYWWSETEAWSRP